MSRCGLLCALGLLVTAGSARAEGRDRAAAEALFRDARAAMQRGAWDVACPKLEESQRLDPAPGTLLNLAECERMRGRIATAWQAYQESLDGMAPGDDRIPLATARIAELAPRLPRLVVRLAPGAPADARVKKDDVELGRASLGAPLPVDPGAHAIVVLANGRSARMYTARVAEGQTTELVADAGPIDLAAKASASETPHGRGTTGGARTLGFVALGIGGTALVVGGITGALAIGRAGVADQHCDAAHQCDPQGLEANRDGKTFATISTIGFVAGAVFVAGGLAWLFTH